MMDFRVSGCLFGCALRQCEPDYPDGPAMEVALDAEDDGFTLWDAFLHVGPLPRELDGRLDRLGSGVHRQDALI